MADKIKRICKKVIKKLVGLKNDPNKNKYILAIVLFFVLISVAAVLLTNIWVMLAIDIVLLVCVCIPGCINNKTVKWIAKERPTSYFQDLRFRNIDGIVVGSTKAWKYIDFKGIDERMYNCTTFRRSFFMNFCTLKTYFGHVKKNGKVIYVVDYTEQQQVGQKIYPRDFNYIHPHIFLQLNKKANKEAAALPLLYYKGFTVKYFFSKLAKNMGMYKNKTWKVEADKNLDINTTKVKENVDKIDKVVHFCWERDLDPTVVLLNGTRDDNCANDIIRAYFAPRFPEVDIRIVNNANELNSIVREFVEE